MQEYQKQSGISTQNISILLEDLRIGKIKIVKSNSGITDHQNQSKTESHLRALLRRPRDYSLMTKYKK